MGCIIKFILTVLAFVGFSMLGWIVIVPGSSLLWLAFWVIIVMALMDLVLWGVKLLVEFISLPLSCLSAGILEVAIDGVFKYFGLFVASLVLGSFTLPWIFGALWWQAILIGVAFAIITFITTSRSSSSRSSD